MLKIHQSSKFQKDFKKYKKDIDQITNETVKAKCNDLLNKLSNEFSYIDAVHDVINRSIDPTKIRENVERSIELRQELNKIIKYSKDL
jgi:hypothetical protein